MAKRYTYRRASLQRQDEATRQRFAADGYAYPDTDPHQNVICTERSQVCLPKYNQELICTPCGCDAPPCTEEGLALEALWAQICPNFDPDYPPPEPVDGEPYCVQCLPANPELQTIFDAIADILEL